MMMTKRRATIAALVTGFLVIALWLGAIAVYAASGALKLKESFASAQAAMQTADIEGAVRSLAVAKLGIASLERAASLAAPVDVLPLLGRERRAARDLFSSLSPAIDALGSTLTVVENAQAALARVGGAGAGLKDTRAWSSLTVDEKRAVLMSLKESNVTLRAGLISLEDAEAGLAKANSTYEHTSLHAVIGPLASAVSDVKAAAELLVPMSEIAPEFLGLNSERQYLVLYLNNSELRPGGGFIGYYGVAQVKNGELTNFASEDSYGPSSRIKDPTYHVNIPAPMTLGLGVKDWFFRDAAWSPDFSETAKTARTLLRQENAAGGLPVPQIDGVIGITPTFVTDLMKLTGPLTLHGKTVTPDELYDVLQYSTQKGFVSAGVGYEDRKYLVAEATAAILDKLQNLPPASWLDVFHVIASDRDSKMFALWSGDAKTQAVLEERGWAGRITPTASEDAFMLVDANLGALKTDPAVTRDIAYSVRLENGLPIATAKVTYHHKGGFDYKTTRYITFARVYAPAGAKLRGVTGGASPVVTATDLGLTTFGTLAVTEPGSDKVVTYEYELPASLVPAVGKSYTLRAYKQLGATGDNVLTVDVAFGNKLSSAVPAEMPANYGDKSYTVTVPLDADKVFSVRY